MYDCVTGKFYPRSVVHFQGHGGFIQGGNGGMHAARSNHFVPLLQRIPQALLSFLALSFRTNQEQINHDEHKAKNPHAAKWGRWRACCTLIYYGIRSCRVLAWGIPAKAGGWGKTASLILLLERAHFIWGVATSHEGDLVR